MWRELQANFALVAMSESAEIAKGEAASASAFAVPPPSACRKKKSEVDEGFVKDLINHIDEFVNASYDEHKSCLQKTVSKVMSFSPLLYFLFVLSELEFSV